MVRKVRGVGINDAGYTVQIKRKINGKNVQVWICPYYRKWTDMFNRTHSRKYQDVQPTYRGTSIDEEWFLFSKFKSWMETQNWQGLELDKDILIEGNKVYSASTCVFVPKYINNLFLSAKRGEYPLGVYREKISGKFRASVRTREGKQKTLGRFSDKDSAHQAWQKGKIVEIEGTLIKYIQEDYFNQKVYDAVKARCDKIKYDLSKGIESL